MHRFLVFRSEGEGPPQDLSGAHLVGHDGIPIRGEIEHAGSEIRCRSRNDDPCGLSLLWTVPGFGTVQLETTRLPARDKPYILNLELARHRLMRITVKREEWGLFDYNGLEEISQQIDEARDLFIQAWSEIDDPPEAARLADQSLARSLWAGERMCAFHAGIFLNRRRQAAGFSRNLLGAAVWPRCATEALSPEVQRLLGFVRLPFVWRAIQPEEKTLRFDRLDAWIEACRAAGLPVCGGPVLSFGVRSVPDWMYVWENDFDTILEYARGHVERCVKRYAGQVPTWVVASGLHADNVFCFNFEQIMEMTRMAVGVTRDISPRAQVVLDLTQPWGEYTAHNQRTIPPLLFADMAVQSGIPFDAFGLQFVFGIGSEGYRLRDLLQISILTDKLANLGKPLHVTAVAVPSCPDDASAGGGQWHQPWSEQVQAEWLAAFCEMALSKPYIGSVCLQTLVDNPDCAIPTGGILTTDLAPKAAFQRLVELTESWYADATR